MKTIKNLLLAAVLLLSYNFTFAQLSIEPALVIRPVSTVFGAGDFGLSAVTNYTLNKRFSVASYTSIINRFYQGGEINNVDVSYRMDINQLFGPGVQFHARKSVHSIYLMAGLGFTSFKEKLQNPELELDQSYSASHLGERFGLLYSWKRKVNEQINFTARAFIPIKVFETVYPDFLEMTLEAGLSISLN